MSREYVTCDGNEAAAYVAHAVSEVVAIYPITPASPMGELADAWSSGGRPNIWGSVPNVIEMQSEGGAAGAVHGALQAGSLTTTFTASQGLLLMIPNLYKIAGELTSCVIHVAARSIATHALSIFGDHSDVMAARQTGFGMLCASSVQEAQDMALIAHAATLESRLPFLHFFDGFRTSHEINKIEQLSTGQIREMIDDGLVRQHRSRALDPNHPVLRGTAQNPDVFFQAREAINPYYANAPTIVQKTMDRFAKITGRQYRLFDYEGAPDATRVIVLMGSGAGAVSEAVRQLNSAGEKVGLLKVRLYRPFEPAALRAVLPKSVKSIAVLDRTKEPGSTGEPLYLDVLASTLGGPKVVGGRYGLSSKEFTPNMARAVFDNLQADTPKTSFTIGIVDDVSHSSLDWDRTPTTEPADTHASVFFGLGSDGTVGANKNTVKIMGDDTQLYTQGYFVYDSKKSGAITISHLRFSPRPIDSTYLVQSAQFVGCHQFNFLEKMDVLTVARLGATVLLNSPYPAKEVWSKLPGKVRHELLDKKLKLYVIDAHEIAKKAGLKGRINTIMQTCFFVLSGVLPEKEAIVAIKDAAYKTYKKAGPAVIEKNHAAIDATIAGLFEVEIPKEIGEVAPLPARVPEVAPDFVKRVTTMMLEGRGDLLPVSAMPVDGTFATGTSRWEKRSIATDIPIWDPDVCTQCGLCPLVCPHAAIRMKAYPPESIDGAPKSFQSILAKDKAHPGWQMSIQVAPDDCTGCGVCVEICPAHSKEVVKHRAINMAPKLDHEERERRAFEFFLDIPVPKKASLNLATVKGSQSCEPLFEFSGACAGCGETPYIKLVTQLFGDRTIVANATGCSSIYGGNLPTTPWTTDRDGRGPAWSNSLFEDNAEFGLGMRLAVDQQTELARAQLEAKRGALGDALVDEILSCPQDNEAEIEVQRTRVAKLRSALEGVPDSESLLSVADYLVDRSVWIIGGDGWAYDIGFGGLDHVLASGRNVNILVLDTEVYSNTGGQASKATPRGAVAKFAASGKELGKKDLGMIAMAYGNVYVAQVALGASPLQTIKAFNEAESYPGVSLIIAYSTCIAHGIDMTKSMTHMKDASQSGYWPLYRFDPRLGRQDGHPFQLDSRKPSIPYKQFAMQEARFAMLTRSNPERAAMLMAKAQNDIDERWHYYEQLAGLERGMEHKEASES